MKVKICGITREVDAMAAADAGAAAVGFIFVPASRRYVSPDAARRMIRNLPPSVTPVGVFVDASRDTIVDAVRASGIRCLQLHGDESPADLEGLPVPAYKAIRVRPGFDAGVLGGYAAPAYLLDTFVEGMQGGTGKTFDWQIAVAAKRYGRIILGGGINPMNAAEAVRAVAPYAIDVSSGVESSPGIKDATKIRMLFDAIRQVHTIETEQEFLC